MAHLISSFEKLLELRDSLEKPASLGFKGEQCRLRGLGYDFHAYCLDEISDFLFDLASSLLHRRYLRGLFLLLGVDTIHDVSSRLVIGKELKKHRKRISFFIALPSFLVLQLLHDGFDGTASFSVKMESFLGYRAFFPVHSDPVGNDGEAFIGSGLSHFP